MRKLFLMMMTVLACSWSLSAQTKTITGTVVDAANNEPLIGASIVPIGGGQGAAADVDGKFTLRVPMNVTKANVSYVGYTTQTVDLKDGMRVYLASNAQDLEDLIVVAYGTANKESLTGSVTVVGADEIEKRPVTSITSALEGNAPGVQVSGGTTAPGGSPAILIRGINTVNGTTAPLYIVDGVEFNGSIADLNPSDVESMSVLKDAASAALYGSRASNGVILITTKRAKQKDRVNVTLSLRQGVYERGLPFYDVMNTNEWMATRLTGNVNQIYYAPGNTMTYQETLTQEIDQFFNRAGVWNIYGLPNADIFNPTTGAIANGVNPQPGYTDLNWWDIISRHGNRGEYNINLTTAGDKYSVFASIGYLKEQGYILKTDFQRLTGRINFDVNPVSYFKFGANIYAGWQTSDQAQFDSDNLSSTSNPFGSVYNAPVFPYYMHNLATGEILYDEMGKPEWNTTPTYAPNSSNIGYLLRSDDESLDRTELSGSIYGTAIIPYGFEFTVRGNIFRRRQTYMDYANPNIGSALGFGRLRKQFYFTDTYQFMQTLNWAHDYGLNHIDVMLNHENYEYDYGYTTITNKNQIFPGVMEISNFEENESFAAYHIMRRSESYLGRARYNYDQKYFGEVSFRRDGSSRFAKDVRWGSFWSVGASWVLSKEKFMQELPWVNYAKFRIAYGTVGNDAAASSYEYWSTYAIHGTRLEGNAAMYPSQIGNMDVKWESSNSLDMALEGTLFNNRFNFSIGYFLRKTSDLLYNVSLPGSAGVTWSGSNFSVTRNVGDMQNWGWELSFSGDIIRNRDVVWNASIDATFIKNKLTKLPSGNQWSSPRALIEGKSRYEYWTYKWVGVDMTNGRGLYELNSTSHDFESLGEDGKYAFDETLWQNRLAQAEEAGALVEYNGRYYVNDFNFASREFVGTSLPTVYGSFSTGVSWKGLNVSLLFTYSLGGKVMDSTYQGLMSLGSATSNFHKDMLNSWTPDMAVADNDPNRINDKINPQVNGLYNPYNTTTSSRWLTNSSSLTLKNININYDLPKKWMKAIKLQGINIGFLVENAFLVTGRKGMTPNYNYAGGQGNYFVMARTYTFSLTARF